MENSLYKEKIDDYKLEYNYKIFGKINENNNFLKDDIFEPIPFKFKCELCKVKYKEYLEHIKSNEHIKKLKEINFENIKNTFKRIVNKYINQGK